MFYTADCVAETSTSTGTGDITLAGAILGYRSFSDWFSVDDWLYYRIEAIDERGVCTGEFEAGIGYYSDTNTLTRWSAFASSNGFSTVDFSAGTKRVIAATLREAVRFTGTHAKKSANQTAANFTTETAITWDAEQWDIDGYHSTSSNTSRMTPTAATAKVKLQAQVSLANVTANTWVSLGIKRSGSYAYDGAAKATVSANTTTPKVYVETPVLYLNGGPFYFEAFLQAESDTSIDIVAAESWFIMERVL